jgi:sulfatase modifying factor 1
MPAKDVFLSYAREDLERAAALVSVLEKQGWSVWWDVNDIPAGKRFDEEIDEALNGARAVLVLWSRHSVESDYVIEEAAEAKELQTLIPIRIDEVKLPRGSRRLQTADLVGWNGVTHPGLAKLLDDVRALVGRGRLVLRTRP